MDDEDLKIKIGTPSELDKATKAAASRPLGRDELCGFGKRRRKAPNVRPHFNIRIPSKSDGQQGFTVEIGVQGTF